MIYGCYEERITIAICSGLSKRWDSCCWVFTLLTRLRSDFFRLCEEMQFSYLTVTIYSKHLFSEINHRQESQMNPQRLSNDLQQRYENTTPKLLRVSLKSKRVPVV